MVYNICVGQIKKTKAIDSMKKVICVETQEVFRSVAEASRHTGVIATNISAVCKNRRRSAGGFHWVYIEEPYIQEELQEELIPETAEELQTADIIEELETSSTHVLDYINELEYYIEHIKTLLKTVLKTVSGYKQCINKMLKLQSELIQRYVNTQRSNK